MSDFKFSCPACGQHIACDTSNAGMNIACPACHATLTVPQPPPGIATSAAAPAAPAAPHGLSIASSQARHTASEAQSHAAMMSRSYTPPPTSAPAGQKTSALAIASLICSLTFCLGFIPGIICGHLARRNTRRDPSLKGGRLAIAGLIISYLTLVSIIVSFAVGVSSIKAVFQSPEFKKALADAEQKQKEIQSGRNSTAATPSSKASDTSAAPLWTLNLTTAEFPDQPVAGKIHGQDFTVDSVKAQNGAITFRQGQNAIPDRQIVLFTFLKNGQPLAGKTYDISPANADMTNVTMPHIHMSWKDDGAATNKTRIFRKGYALKLEFGAANAAGKIPGKIYLCVPDGEKSYLAGTFEIEAKKEPGRPRRQKKPPAN